MNTQFTKIDWRKILLAGAAAIALSLLIPAIVIALYAMILAIVGQGAPDTAKLHRFANLVSGWGSQIVVAFATVRAAMWAARKAGYAPQLHGVMTGVTAAISGAQLTVLALTSVTALFVAAKLFRWESNEPLSWAKRAWVAAIALIFVIAALR